MANKPFSCLKKRGLRATTKKSRYAREQVPSQISASGKSGIVHIATLIRWLPLLKSVWDFAQDNWENIF